MSEPVCLVELPKKTDHFTSLFIWFAENDLFRTTLYSEVSIETQAVCSTH